MKILTKLKKFLSGLSLSLLVLQMLFWGATPVLAAVSGPVLDGFIIRPIYDISTTSTTLDMWTHADVATSNPGAEIIRCQYRFSTNLDPMSSWLNGTYFADQYDNGSHVRGAGACMTPSLVITTGANTFSGELRVTDSGEFFTDSGLTTLAIRVAVPTVTVDNVVTNNTPLPTIHGTIDDPTAIVWVEVFNSDYSVYYQSSGVNNGDNTWDAIVTDPLPLGSYSMKITATNYINDGYATGTYDVVNTAPIIHTQGDFAAFDGVNIIPVGTNFYTLSSSITATYTGDNTIKLTGYAPIVIPWFMPDWTTYNYVTIGIDLPAGFSGNPTVFSTGVMKYDDPTKPDGYYDMGSGSTPLATTGDAFGYLDFSFGANKSYVKNGLVKLEVIWNVGDAPEYFTIDVNNLSLTDTTAPPTPTHSSPANNSYLTTVNWTLADWSNETDTNGPVTYIYESSLTNTTRSDGSFISPVYVSSAISSSQISTAGTSQGTYYWHVRSQDELGNASAWSAPWKVTVDNTVPTLAIANPTAGQVINGRIITINGTATDTNFNYYYCYVSNVNGHEYGTRDASCTTTRHAVTPTSLLGSVTLPNDLPDGNYVVHLIGYDKAMNSAETTQSFVLDNTAPNANITSPLVGDYVRGTIDITGAFSDNNHEFNSIFMGFTGNDKNGNQLSWCHSEAPGFGIDDGTRTCSFDTTKLSDGSHKIEIWAMDKAGTWGTGLNQSINVMVDNTAPVMSNIKMFVNGSESSLLKSGDAVRIEANVSDPSDVDKVQLWFRNFENTVQLLKTGYMTHGTGDQYSFEFTAPATYEGNLPINENLNKNYLIFRTYDGLGNFGYDGRTYFTIDNTAPIISAATPISIEILSATHDFMADVSAIDGGSGLNGSIAITSNDVDLNLIGTYHVTYEVSDKAGNVGTKIIEVNVVDTTVSPLPIVPPVAPAPVTFGNVLTPVAVVVAPQAVEDTTPAAVQGAQVADEQVVPVVDEQSQDVKGETDSTDNNQSAPWYSSKVLGIAIWLWLLLLAIAGGLWWFLAYRRRNQS